jgi:hypothetical protein
LEARHPRGLRRSRDAARRLPVARSDRWATAWSFATARGERYGTTVSRRLAAA